MIGQMFSPEGVHVSIQMLTRWNAAPALYPNLKIKTSTAKQMTSYHTSLNSFKQHSSYELNVMRDPVFLPFIHFNKMNENVAFLFNH